MCYPHVLPALRDGLEGSRSSPPLPPLGELPRSLCSPLAALSSLECLLQVLVVPPLSLMLHGPPGTCKPAGPWVAPLCGSSGETRTLSPPSQGARPGLENADWDRPPLRTPSTGSPPARGPRARVCAYVTLSRYEELMEQGCSLERPCSGGSAQVDSVPPSIFLWHSQVRAHPETTASPARWLGRCVNILFSETLSME